MKLLTTAMLSLGLAISANASVTQEDINAYRYILIGEPSEFTNSPHDATKPLFIKIDKCVFDDPEKTKHWHIPMVCPERIVLIQTPYDQTGGQ